ncbi:MAG: hypothetical protein A2076_10050 [Geobacteraceae bacterium GWC2_53_11]|nr:MAG: hypothetical protein A2076_10050 [Geobacteraceae bacterium GWC2_53_11]
MAKTTAERQSAFRLRRNDEASHKRINTWIQSGAHRALVRLSKYLKVSQAEVIEKLIATADESVKKTLGRDADKIIRYVNGMK